jgi:hypothetical protein
MTETLGKVKAMSSIPGGGLVELEDLLSVWEGERERERERERLVS